MIGEPVTQIEALVLIGRLLLCVLFDRKPGREVLELFRSYNDQLIRCRDDATPSVRALGRVVTFPRDRAVEFPDSG